MVDAYLELLQVEHPDTLLHLPANLAQKLEKQEYANWLFDKVSILFCTLPFNRATIVRNFHGDMLASLDMDNLASLLSGLIRVMYTAVVYKCTYYSSLLTILLFQRVNLILAPADLYTIVGSRTINNPRQEVHQ